MFSNIFSYSFFKLSVIEATHSYFDTNVPFVTKNKFVKIQYSINGYEHELHQKYFKMLYFIKAIINWLCCLWNSITGISMCQLLYNETQLTFYDFRHNNSFQCQASFVIYWQASGGLLAIRLYSCNKITTTWIQIFRQNWNGFFSNISHQMMI